MCPVYSFWCRVPSQGNVGDAVGPWLIARITGAYPRFAPPGAPVTKIFGPGSIIGYARAGCVVWGSGIMHRDEWVSPEAEVRAVRGPLTREAVIHSGGSCPCTYGDPALLLPRYYTPREHRRGGIGLVAHFSDKVRLPADLPGPDLRLIDVQRPVEAFVDEITACSVVASSSLHGLIIAHAYGVPAVWVSFGPLPSGDGSKFADYYASVGLDPVAPLRLAPLRADRAAVAAAIASGATLPAALPDSERLLDCCPFA